MKSGRNKSGEANMLIVGLTGRSGSGKTTVSRYYQSKGYPAVDGDAVSRAVTTKGSACLKELTDAFGTDILNEDGTLNRKKLGSIAFSSAQNNALLVAITHPYITRTLWDLAQTARQEGAKLLFVDGAMIVGSPAQALCDKLIVVTTDAKLSISRIILRDGISKTSASQRLNAQKSDEALRSAADFVIENNASKKQLLQAADDVLHQLLQAVESTSNCDT